MFKLKNKKKIKINKNKISFILIIFSFIFININAFMDNSIEHLVDNVVNKSFMGSLFGLTFFVYSLPTLLFSIIFLVRKANNGLTAIFEFLFYFIFNTIVNILLFIVYLFMRKIFTNMPVIGIEGYILFFIWLLIPFIIYKKS